MAGKMIDRILDGEDISNVLMESASKPGYHAKYVISSERASRRSDEDHVEFSTDKILNVGDEFELDGLMWHVDEILYDADRNIGTD